MTAPEREALVKRLESLADVIDAAGAQPEYSGTARDAAAFLKSVPAPAVTVTEGWQPIKSAPNDNTKVLIYVPPERINGTDYPAIVMVSRFKGYWWDAGHLKPTHWQTLPPPPSTTPQTGSQE